MALGAQVSLLSENGLRTVALEDFYIGVRKTVMAENELLTDITFPVPSTDSRSTFIKLGLRRAQAISVINVAVIVELKNEIIEQATITLGSVAPTIVHAREAEKFLLGKSLDFEVIESASRFSAQAATPIDDLRGSAAYRKDMVRVCTQRALQSLTNQQEREGYPEHPVMLWGVGDWHWEETLDESFIHEEGSPIEMLINGQPYRFTTGQDKTLLHLLRDEAGLIGTKEGCAEGECGACTVFLDGMAVMSCLVPAPRAHGAEIITIEGLGDEDDLHPLQRSFIEEGAVQCGYCTPGFLMSGAKLLEEIPNPSKEQIEQAITGNLCRCTGYYKIISAFEKAGGYQGTRG
jgi:carbon-monoxide dehydrogenase medium subunit